MCLLQHKSMLNPNVHPAIAQVLLLLENELLDLHLQQVWIHVAHSPLPSQHPRAKKTTDFDLLLVKFHPLKLPTSVPELLGTRLPHSVVRRARDPHAARCLRLFVLTVTSILHIYNETINTKVNLERRLEESEQVSSASVYVIVPFAGFEPWNPTCTILLKKHFNECCYPKACRRRGKDSFQSSRKVLVLRQASWGFLLTVRA